MPIPYILEQQALAAQAYEAAARAREAEARARAADLEAAAKRFEATGATCEIQSPLVADASQRCGESGAGRCQHCERVFCRTHRSASPVTADVCGECQVRLRQEATAAAEIKRQAEREELEQLEREHAQRVAQREARLGWAAAQKRIAWLDDRITRYQWAAPVSGARVFGALLPLIAVPIFAAIAFNGLSGNGTRSALIGGAGTLTFLVFAPRAVRTLWNGRRHRLHKSYEDERRELLTRQGCGVQGCPRCLLDRQPAPQLRRDVASAPVRAAAARNSIALGVAFLAATAGERILWAAVYVPHASGAPNAVGLISGLVYLALGAALPVTSSVLAARTVTRLSLVARRAQVVSKINLDAAFDWKSIWAAIIVMAVAGYLAWAPAITAP